jgi:hypothetical protein
LLDLPGDVEFPFLGTLQSDNNLKIMSGYISKFYGFFKSFYKEYASINDLKINHEHVPSYLRAVMEDKLKLIDQEKYNLLSV